MVESNDSYSSAFDANFTNVTRSLSANFSRSGNAEGAILYSKLLQWLNAGNANNYFLLPPILIMLLTCLLLNATIVIVIAFEKRLHKPANAYILSLACVDILDGCFPIVSLLHEKALRRWQLPIFFCYAKSFLTIVVAHVSLNHMLLMAYDRYSAIMHPLTYSRPNRKFIIALQIFGAYAVALVVWGSPLIIYGYVTIEDSCGMNLPQIVKFTLFGLTYFGNYSATLYFYGRCVWCIWTQFYRVKPLVNKTKTVAVSGRRKVQPTSGDPSKPKASLSTKTKTAVLEFTNEVSVDNETEMTNVGVTVDYGGETEALPAVNVRPQPSRNQVGTSDQSSNKRRNNLTRSLRNVGVYVGAFSLLIMPYPISWLINYIIDKNSDDTTDMANYSIADIVKRILAGDLNPTIADFVNSRINSHANNQISPLDIAVDVIQNLPYVHTNVHPLLFMLTQREFRIAVKTMFKKLSKFLRR